MLRSPVVWLVLGSLAAAVWFCAASSLPPLLRGKTCCDAVSYLHLAESSKIAGAFAATGTGTVGGGSSLLHTVFTALTADTGYRTLGYPAFLAAHRYVLHVLGLSSAVDWFSLSTFTALLLHLVSALFFWRGIRRHIDVHPIGLFLLLAYPPLVAHAAVPLTDSLAVSLLLLALGSLLRVAPETRKRLWAALGGLFLGLLVITRPSHLPAAVVVITVWLTIAGMRKWRRYDAGMFACACIAAACFVLPLAPRIASCSLHAGTLCFTPPGDNAYQTAFLIQVGNDGARTQTVVWGKSSSAIYTVTDAFFQSSFARCPIVHPGPDLLRCYARNAPLLPLFFLKKTVGLFDHPGLTPYATVVTPAWVTWTNRTGGLLGFLGFLALAAWALHMIRRKQWTSMSLLAALYALVYWAYSSVISVEARYGLPLTAMGLVLFPAALSALTARRDRAGRLLLILWLCLGLFFLVQGGVWDALDPVRPATIREITAQPPVQPAGLDTAHTY